MNKTMLVLGMAAVMVGAVMVGASDAWAQPRATTQPAGPAVAVPPPPTIVPVLGPGRGQVVLTWDEFVKITGYDPARKGTQVLTIPWKEVEQLLGVELKDKVALNSTMVDLPWKEFMALLEWSVRKKGDAAAPPPADFIVSTCRYEGKLEVDQVAFTLTLKLNVLRKSGWKRIPVLPSSVAVTESKLPEGVHLNVNGNMYELLTEASGPVDATIGFVVQVNKSSGIQSVSFDRVLQGSATVDLTTDNEQTEVKVAGAQSQVARPSDKKVAAALAAGTPVSISWERVIKKAAATPKLYAESATLVSVAEGVLVCQSAISLNVLHAPIKEFKLTVPKEASILEVTGTNVQDWRVEKDQLAVTLRGEVVGAYALRVSYEAQAAGEAVEVPLIRPVGVEREKGYVGVAALANVEIAPGVTVTATKIDVQQLPGDLTVMTKQPILLGFRYVGEQAAVSLAVKRHAEVQVLVTIADSVLATIMQLEDGRRMTRIIYNVRNNRTQFLRVQLPEGVDLWSSTVGGNTVTPGSDEKSKRVILVPLIRSSAAAQELASFPVELVYVETPAQPAPAEGTLRVALPTLDGVPVVHVMVNYYAPARGEYGKGGGLFAPPQSGFAGALKLVDQFATMATDRAGGAVIKENLPQQAQEMQQKFEARVEQQARAAGATPIRVRLPIDGKLFKLEKILALPNDELFFSVTYSGWKKE